ncbi:Creatinase/aminopeptidase [Sporormia fimetaria CBS 119925]|uniref:Xaa-Pro aminopeptidase n=1 Tax=Sporormia fimetaria CBS 119925 TaxID=1340428 RepID=A0A6A6V586_9PLEO|nr:Creatinase/aminopeptidase [Sporormia fimetaria CBS 119925]
MASQTDGGPDPDLLRHLLEDYSDRSIHINMGSNPDKYPAKQHARRVAQELDYKRGIIYMEGEITRNMADSDMPVPFRQFRDFYYLTGCNEPGCSVIYNIGEDRLILLIPRPDPDRELWYGPVLGVQEALDRYDIDDAFYEDARDEYLLTEVIDNDAPFSGVFMSHFPDYLPSGRPAQPGREDVRMQTLLARYQMSPYYSDQPNRLRGALSECRVIKDDHEIGLIRKANEISSRAHREVLSKISTFDNEAQVEGLFLNVCVSNQARNQAYNIIAASGSNAATLHYDKNNDDFDDKQLLCLDAGCEWDLYASDITRTFPLKGEWPSKEAKQIYDLVRKIQEACIKIMMPRQKFYRVFGIAHMLLVRGLQELGILRKGHTAEILRSGVSRAFFPHGLGHHVGLDVHDPSHKETASNEEYSAFVSALKDKYPGQFDEDAQLDELFDEQIPALILYAEHEIAKQHQPSTCHAPCHPTSTGLEEGMVVTVEPGIYFNRRLIAKFLDNPDQAKWIDTEVLERFMPVGGVRIEDDILITAKGHENLTNVPKGEDMLDMIRNKTTEPSPSSRPLPDDYQDMADAIVEEGQQMRRAHLEYRKNRRHQKIPQRQEQGTTLAQGLPSGAHGDTNPGMPPSRQTKVFPVPDGSLGYRPAPGISPEVYKAVRRPADWPPFLNEIMYGSFGSAPAKAPSAALEPALPIRNAPSGVRGDGSIFAMPSTSLKVPHAEGGSRSLSKTIFSFPPILNAPSGVCGDGSISAMPPTSLETPHAEGGSIFSFPQARPPMPTSPTIVSKFRPLCNIERIDCVHIYVTFKPGRQGLRIRPLDPPTRPLCERCDSLYEHLCKQNGVDMDDSVRQRRVG